MSTMSIVNEKANKLIGEAYQHRFCDNCYQDQYGTFCRPSPAMAAWLDDVETFIFKTFGQDSIPRKIFSKFNRRKLNGYYEEDMEKQKNIILSALHACIGFEEHPPKRLQERPIKLEKESNPLRTLIVIVILLGAWGGYSYCTREKRTYNKALETKIKLETQEKLENQNEHEKIKHLYKIVSSADHSYTVNGQHILRKEYRVRLLGTTTKEQMKKIAEAVVAPLPANAIIIYFYFPDSDTSGAFSAGMAVYAPNGQWKDANLNAQRRLVMEYAPTEAELAPQYKSKAGLVLSVSQRKKIFWAIVKAEDNAGITGDYEQCRRIIGNRYGIPASEVIKIEVEGCDKRWPMPEDPDY